MVLFGLVLFVSMSTIEVGHPNQPLQKSLLKMFYGNTFVCTRCKGKLGSWGILEKKPKVFFGTDF